MQPELGLAQPYDFFDFPMRQLLAMPSPIFQVCTLLLHRKLFELELLEAFKIVVRLRKLDAFPAA